jgi:hypothetical protein
VKLSEGQEAPFNGFLITPERTERLVKAERQNVTLRELKIAQEDLVKFHKGQSKAYQKRLQEAKFDSVLSNSGYFLLGVVLTGIAFKSANIIGGM